MEEDYKAIIRHRHRAINGEEVLTAEGFEYLMVNIVKACSARGIQKIDALPLNEWHSMMRNRVGNEPLVVLLYRALKAVENARMTISEILCEDPVLFITCLTQGDITPYYQEW